jgi:hypothetical protein
LALGLAEAHRAAAPAALHPVHEEDPDADQHEDRQPQADHAEEAGLLLRRGLDPDVVFKEHPGRVRIRRGDGGIGSVGRRELHPFAIERRGYDLTVLDLLDEVGIGHPALIHLRLATREQVEQGKDQQEQDHPECDVSRVAQGKSPQNTGGGRQNARLSLR